MGAYTYKTSDLLVTSIEKNEIKQNSPETLPLNPTGQGFSGQEVRRRLSHSIVGEEGSLLSLFTMRMQIAKDILDNVFEQVENLISASDGIDLNMLGYMNYAADIYYKGRKQSLFANAWEHSLTVDPLEISANGTTSNKRGKAQYPNGEIEGVIIPQGVTSIGNYAFSDWRANNQPLVIPDSITSIGNYAFSDWRANNQPLVIPDSITSIGNYAFSDWRANNQPLVIPNSVTSIGTYAFSYWSANNQTLVIPNSVTSIGSYAFQYWTSNNHPLVIPDSVTSIGSRAFRNWTSNNQPLVIPDSVTEIGNDAFYNWTSNNQPLVIPDSVTSIGTNAFENWRANNHPLVIPDSVTSIGSRAFRNWNLNNHPLVIPNSVTSIGDYAFNNWALVPYVEIWAITPPTLAHINAFNNQNNAPIYVPDESVDDYKAATNWVNLADRIFPISDKDYTDSQVKIDDKTITRNDDQELEVDLKYIMDGGYL